MLLEQEYFIVICKTVSDNLPVCAPRFLNAKNGGRIRKIFRRSAIGSGINTTPSNKRAPISEPEDMHKLLVLLIYDGRPCSWQSVACLPFVFVRIFRPMPTHKHDTSKFPSHLALLVHYSNSGFARRASCCLVRVALFCLRVQNQKAILALCRLR